MSPPLEMDLEDLAAVLNSDSESALLSGLRRFASHIRRDHGLLPPPSPRGGNAQRPVPVAADAEDKEPPDGLAVARGSSEEMDVAESDAESGDTDEEEVDAMEEEKNGDYYNAGQKIEKGGVETDGVQEARCSASSEGRRGGGEPDGAALTAALVAAAEAGEAPGLLGEYLRGSSQLNDLLAVWDLDVRKSSPLLAAAHTDSLAAVLECLAVVLSQLAAVASTSAAANGAGSVFERGAAVEATGLRLCRTLMREKMELLQGQLSTAAAPASGKKKGGAAARPGVTGEEGAAATLRLLTSVARFHRLAAKELAGVFNFTHKAFVKLVSSRRGGASGGPAAAPAGAAATPSQGAEKDITPASGSKKGRKSRKAAEAAAAAAAAAAEQQATAASKGPQDVREDTRHLSVDLLCAFMDSEDPALQMQMVSGARVGSALGLIFRGSLWRDPPETRILVVETLHRRVLRNRRVSRRAKADFFSVAGIIEHLRKLFDDASPRLYKALHGLMSALLCQPSTSPFLLEMTTPAAPPSPAHNTVGGGYANEGGVRTGSRGRDRAVVSWPRPLLAGLASLGAHEDLGQRELLLSTLDTCPSLLGPYLRTFPAAMLEARPTYNLLQTYSLISVVLRKVPVAPFSLGVGEVEIGRGGRRAPDVMLSTVMPMALGKKDLTKGVLSVNSLLQAVTMNLMASILDRSMRVCRAATAVAGASSSAPPVQAAAGDMISALRQRMPEVQTLLGLRDKLGGGGGKSSPGTQQTDKVIALRWRLLSLLDCYARVIPSAVVASRFDFLKLLASSVGGESGLSNMHPLVQLATLRLLARDGVVATPTASSGGGGGARSSGWLVEITGASGGGAGSGLDAARSKQDSADRTPLGAVLKVALEAPSQETRLAARALAVRALQSLGIVTVPARRWVSGGGSGDDLAVMGAVGEGEAGVWLDFLTPQAVGALVFLARDAFADARTLMAAGIRAAERAIVDMPFLVEGYADGDTGNDRREGDWEVEFSTLSMAAVKALAGVDQLFTAAAQSSTVSHREDKPGATAGVGSVSPPLERREETPWKQRMDDGASAGAAPFGGSVDAGKASASVDADAARYFSSVVQRVIHLHQNPRPFAGVCIAFAAAAATATAESGTEGVGDARESGHGSATPGAKACQGLALSITRAFGGKPLACNYAPADKGHQEATAAVQLLLRKTAPLAEAAAAASRLESVLADNPGIHIFALDPVRKALLAAAPQGRESAGAWNIPTLTGTGAPDAAAAHAAEDVEPLLRLLSLPIVPLPRLLADAFAVVPGGRVVAGESTKGGKTTSTRRSRETERQHSGVDGTDAGGPLLLPAVDERVFSALVGRLTRIGGEGLTAAEAVAAVRQIVSQVDIALGGSRLESARGQVPATVEAKNCGGPISDGGALFRRREDDMLLLSTGIQLAARACLGIVSLGARIGGAAAAAVDVGEDETEQTPEQQLFSGSTEDSSKAQGRKPGEGAALIRPTPAYHDSWRASFAVLADIFRRPFLIRLACPLSDHDRRIPNGTSAGDGQRGLSPGEVICTDLSALLVAAVAAEEDTVAEMGNSPGRMTHKSEGRGVVARAAAPFLERLCRSTAAAVVSGSPNLRWLAQALIVCRGSCSGDALSRVLATLIARLTEQPPPAASTDQNQEAQVPGINSLVRHLLEQLLVLSRWGAPNRDGSIGGDADRTGGGALVQKLDPASMAALVELQVGSPSPELGRLVCFALTGNSGDTARLDADGAATAASTAASAGLLEDDSLFRHFFGCLAAGVGIDESTGSDGGDGPYARILEELVQSCPTHADRLARALPRALRDVPPVTHSTAANTDAVEAAAAATLLAVRRPLEALLKTGILDDVSSIQVKTFRVRDRRRLHGKHVLMGGADTSAHGHIMRGSNSTAAVAAAIGRPPYPELTGLLPKFIPTLFDAAVGMNNAAGSNRLVAVAETGRGKGAEGDSNGGGGATKRQEREKSLLACLEAVLKAVSPGNALRVTAAAPAVYGTAFSALQRSMSASERSEKVSSANALNHALARAKLFAWLTADTSVVVAGTTAAGASTTVSARPVEQQNIRREYLRHCLSRAAAAAKDVGRMTRKSLASAAAADRTGTEPSSSGLLLMPPPAAAAAEEALCEFLLDEAARILTEAQPRDSADGLDAGSLEQPGPVPAPAVPMAERLLGLGRDGGGTKSPESNGAKTTGDSAANVLKAFLTSVLKHRLGHPVSLQAVRLIASALYQRQGAPQQGRQTLSMAEGAGPETNDDVGGGDGSEEEDSEAGEEDEFLRAANEAAAAPPLLPGWPAATMLERVVGHSSFLPVLSAEGPCRAELLKLLVLLVSAGGVIPREFGGGVAAAAHGAGLALVRPLLAVYGASLSAEDQLIVRLLRLLQASGVRLDPDACRWGPAAATAGQTESPGKPLLTAATAGSCAWLVTALEPRRLRVSIEAFPVERELEPSPFPFEAGERKPPVGTAAAGSTGSKSTATAGDKKRQRTGPRPGEEDIEEEGSGTDGSASSSSNSGDSSGTDDDGSGAGGSDDEEDAGRRFRREDGEDDHRRSGHLELAGEAPGGATGGGFSGSGFDAQIYDPCFLLPLVEWGLRTAGVTAQAVCESPLLGFIISATSSLSLSTRASAYSCLFHLLEALQQQEAAVAGAGGGTGAIAFKAKRAADAAFRQRPQLTLLLRCLKDGVETPLQRVPCAVALVLARAADILVSSPGSELYKAINSFLLHRPYMRLNELPLFDTLFTGVQQGEGGRGTASVDAWGASGSDLAAIAKARLWMLRALRDGIRTSQDLELASRKRALPLLLAMADSPVGDGDVVIQGLVLDVLCKIASLRRSGARYLLNSIGVVAWCRVVLGRGLNKGRITPANAAGGSGGAAGANSVRGTAAGVERSLPAHLQVQVLSLLTHLLRSGRQMTPHPPALLEEEFSLLAPEVVRCAAVAAAAAVLDRGAEEAGGKGGARGSRRASADAAGGAVNADIVAASVTLLEELQMGIPRRGVGETLDNEPSVGRGRGSLGMRLSPRDALRLSGAVNAIAGDSPCARNLKGRTVILLASPGALLTAARAAAARTLTTWALAAAHEEALVEETPPSREFAARTMVQPTLTNSRDGQATSVANEARGRNTTAPRATPVDVALAALTLVGTLACGTGEGASFGGKNLRAATCAVSSHIAATAWSTLALAHTAARFTPSLDRRRGCVLEDGSISRASLLRAAVASVLALLTTYDAIVKPGSGVGESAVGPLLVSQAVPPAPFGSRRPLLTALCRTWRSSELLFPIDLMVGVDDPNGLGGGVSGGGRRDTVMAMRDWAARTAATMLSAVVPFPSSPLDAKPAKVISTRGGGMVPVQQRIGGKVDGEEELRGGGASDVYDVERVAAVCLHALQSLPPGLEREWEAVHFVEGARAAVREISAAGFSPGRHPGEEGVNAEGLLPSRGPEIPMGVPVLSPLSKKKSKRRRVGGRDGNAKK